MAPTFHKLCCRQRTRNPSAHRQCHSERASLLQRCRRRLHWSLRPNSSATSQTSSGHQSSHQDQSVRPTTRRRSRRGGRCRRQSHSCLVLCTVSIRRIRACSGGEQQKQGRKCDPCRCWCVAPYFHCSRAAFQLRHPIVRTFGRFMLSPPMYQAIQPAEWNFAACC